MALKMAGFDEDAIAYRLRWHRATVQHYLRECRNLVDDICARAIRGAMLLD